jgi:hypothetical protein
MSYLHLHMANTLSAQPATIDSQRQTGLLTHLDMTKKPQETTASGVANLGKI